MIILDSTLRKLQVVLSAAKTTNDCPWVSSYADITTTTFTPGTSLGNTNGVTAVDVLAAPAASTQRQLKYFNLYNADTASKTFTVRYNDNATLYSILTVTLAVGDQLVYNAEIGWRVQDSSGNLKQVGTSFAAQNANQVFAGPTTGAAAVPAFRALVGADLPNPSATTLGGIESLAAVTSKWINTISTSGVPSATQPASTDLSDYATGSWTPNDASGAGLTLTVNSASYVKIGKQVTASWSVTYPSTANGNIAKMGGLPYNPATGVFGFGGMPTSATAFGRVEPAAAFILPLTASGGVVANSAVSTLTLVGSVSYIT